MIPPLDFELAFPWPDAIDSLPFQESCRSLPGRDEWVVSWLSNLGKTSGAPPALGPRIVIGLAQGMLSRAFFVSSRFVDQAVFQGKTFRISKAFPGDLSAFLGQAALAGIDIHKLRTAMNELA
jgi:hypothetical protein